MVTKAKNSSLEAVIAVTNVGTGLELLVNEGTTQQSVLAKTIKSGPNVSIIDDGTSLTFSALGSGGTGGLSGATNLGTGTGVSAGVALDVLQLKSLKAGTNVSIADSGSEITINATGSGGSGEANTSSNLGTGVGLAAAKSGVDLPFKSLKAGTNISLSATADEVTINATGSASGEVNTASNVGAGAGVFKAKTGVDLAFKSLVAGANVTLTPGSDTITIAAAGGSSAAVVKPLTDFGAVGDGTTDNTAAFTAAMAWIIANKKPVFVPAGHYKTGPFTLYTGTHQDWCGFYGEDPKRTIIQDVGTSSGPLFTCGSSSMTTYAGYFRFANLTFQANGTSGSAVRIYDLAWTTFENCYFQGGAAAFECYGSVNITFSGCGFQYAGTGLLVTKFIRAGGGWPNNIKLVGGIVGSNSACGINFDYGRQFIIEGTQIEGNGTTVGSATHGGIIVGANVGQETGTNATNAHPGLICSNVWFEQNTGIADVYLQSGYNTLSDSLFWSQSTLVTNNVRISGQKYALTNCDFAHTFSASVPNVAELASVLAGNVISGGEIPNATWNNQKTTFFTGAAVYAPSVTSAGGVSAASSITAGTTIAASGAVSGASVTATGTVQGGTVTSTGDVTGNTLSSTTTTSVGTNLTVSGTATITGNVSTRSMNLAPLWNALNGATVPKPIVIIGFNNSGSTGTVSFGKTMANTGTVVILQAVDAVDSMAVRAPLVTAVTATGFSFSKDVITTAAKQQANYGMYWIAIGQEA